MNLRSLAAAAAASLAIAVGLSGCQSVAGFSQPSLVRVIDASYIAPAVNIYVEKTLFAGNVGEGFISGYGTVTPSQNALVAVTQAQGGASLVTANVTLQAGAEHSIFLTDNGASPTQYTVTVLEDAQMPAASGHSEFRFLNQAPRTGAVDVYMIPAGTTMANTIPLCTDIAVGATCGYVSFASQSVTMVIVPTGQDHAEIHLERAGVDGRRGADGRDHRQPAHQRPAGERGHRQGRGLIRQLVAGSL